MPLGTVVPPTRCLCPPCPRDHPLQQETLCIPEPYELLEGSQPLSPPPAAAASSFASAARSLPAAHEVPALTARARSLAMAEPFPGLTRAGAAGHPQQRAGLARLRCHLLSSPAALINNQSLISGALLSPPAATCSFSPAQHPCASLTRRSPAAWAPPDSILWGPASAASPEEEQILGFSVPDSE